eukprot:8461089-Karenia_brevis.AAC.1
MMSSLNLNKTMCFLKTESTTDAPPSHVGAISRCRMQAPQQWRHSFALTTVESSSSASSSPTSSSSSSSSSSPSSSSSSSSASSSSSPS